MASNPIYVETEEEIPELVERLRRYHGEDTMVVLPMRSRIGQSRFNFQLLRNYSARLGKRVTVVGFGTFLPRKRKARAGRSPANGKEIKISAKTVPAFAAGQGFKQAVDK